MPTELQNNSLGQLRRTLEDLSSLDRQRVYKEKVPFVHVSRELLAQWDTQIGYLRGEKTKWFRELLNAAHVSAMEHFDTLVQQTDSQLGRPRPDVPEIFQHVAWLELGSEAERLLELLPE